MTVYNNTVVDCGWRRKKNKKGGSVWVEKAAKPIFVNNLVYDCRYGLKQPAKDGVDMEHSRLAPNYYYASTETCLLYTSIQAHTLDGIVKDNKTGEPLIGTVVRVKELPNVGTTTGLDGSFTLHDLPDKGKYTLVVTFMAYKTRRLWWM